jgi:hypothetical protein
MRGGGLLAGAAVAGAGLYGAKKLHDAGVNGKVSLGVGAGSVIGGGILAAGGFRSAGKILDMAAAQRTTKMLAKDAMRNARKAKSFKGLGGVGLATAAAGGGYGYYQSKQGNYGKAAIGMGVGVGGLVLGGKSLSKGINHARLAADSRFAMTRIAEVSTKGNNGRISSAVVAGAGKRAARAVSSGGRRAVSALPTGPMRGAVSTGASGVTAAGIAAYRNQPTRARGIFGSLFS